MFLFAFTLPRLHSSGGQLSLRENWSDLSNIVNQSDKIPDLSLPLYNV